MTEAAALTDDISLWAGLKEVYGHLSVERRRQFYLLLGLMLVGAFAELATIGAVLPFLTLLADPGASNQLPWPLSRMDFGGFGAGNGALVHAVLLFSVLAIVAGLVRLQLTWTSRSFGFRLGHELAVNVERRILHQPYSFHIQRHSSALLTAIAKSDMLALDVVLPLMQAAIGAFLSAFIIAALMYVDAFTALIAAAAFSIVYLLVSAVTQGRLAKNSIAIATGFNERMKIVQESLSGIRDVIIDNTQSAYLQPFERVNEKLSVARATTNFIASAPRLVIETIGMVLIAAITVVLSQRQGGIAAALPILGALALGAQRLLPLLQQIYSGWSMARGSRSVLADVVELLRLPIGEDSMAAEPAAPLPLRDSVTFEDVSFTYPGRPRPILAGLNLQLPAGLAIALVGETGSGKSTLADVLMGLLEPDEGRILIDGVQLTAANRRRWQKSIAHVPQSIFLADTTIARNIALGATEEPVHLPRIIEAAKTAQLHEFVTSLVAGYDTLVGERGVRLSGGQRQRLGIARAIYKQAPVLVLDEATSALDEDTEAAVMDGLYRLGEEGRTIIIVAHRLSTIARCDRIVRIHDGRIVEAELRADPPKARPRTSRRS